MSATTFRTDLAAAILTMLADFKTANPTMLAHVYDTRPEGFNELPCAYLVFRPETIDYSNGLRHRTLGPDIVFVDRQTTNAETLGRRHALIDAFTSHLDAYPHLVAGTWWSTGTWQDEDEDLGDGHVTSAARFSFGAVDQGLGRN